MMVIGLSSGIARGLLIGALGDAIGRQGGVNDGEGSRPGPIARHRLGAGDRRRLGLWRQARSLTWRNGGGPRRATTLCSRLAGQSDALGDIELDSCVPGERREPHSRYRFRDTLAVNLAARNPDRAPSMAKQN